MGDVKFDGKVAIVTGAGGGLGRSHALSLASMGVKVVFNDLGGTMDGSGSGSAMADKVVDEIKAAGGEAGCSGMLIGSVGAISADRWNAHPYRNSTPWRNPWRRFEKRNWRSPTLSAGEVRPTDRRGSNPSRMPGPSGGLLPLPARARRCCAGWQAQTGTGVAY